MKSYLFLMLVCLFLATINVNAQDRIVNSPDSIVNAPQNIMAFRPLDRTSFALGAGLDYGGLGGNLVIYPHQNIGLIGGLGYALGGMGYNAGFKFRLISKKHFTNPYALALYGYNAAIAVKDASQYNKLFYGPSIGFGLDLHSKKMKSNYWTVALLIPFRKSEVNDYIDDLKDNHGVEFKSGLMPFTVSIGYRITSSEF